MLPPACVDGAYPGSVSIAGTRVCYSLASSKHLPHICIRQSVKMHETYLRNLTPTSAFTATATTRRGKAGTNQRLVLAQRLHLLRRKATALRQAHTQTTAPGRTRREHQRTDRKPRRRLESLLELTQGRRWFERCSRANG